MHQFLAKVACTNAAPVRAADASSTHGATMLPDPQLLPPPAHAEASNPTARDNHLRVAGPPISQHRSSAPLHAIDAPTERVGASLPWDGSDWDLVLVLPLPEEQADTLATSQTSRLAQREARDASEEKLRRALQLTDADKAPFDGGDGERSSTAWLIGKLRERVLASGLCCKVLKLSAGSDTALEGAGEYEIQSGHAVTMLCIGAHKQRDEAASGAERFPRLELEAERRSMRLTTRLGARARFTRSGAQAFPAFRSELRQRITEAILEARCGDEGDGADGGAGLHLAQLISSGRVTEMIHVHDDDEASAIKDRIVRSWAGVRPMRRETLVALHAYVGAEVSFYFAWLAAYTRSLWLPAALGAALWLTDELYYNEAMAEFYNTTHANATSGQWLYSRLDVDLGDRLRTAGVVRAALTASMGLLMLLWGALFEEFWKRRSVSLATQWGELDNDVRMGLNQRFRAKRTTPGFYTQDGVFVHLDLAHCSNAEERERLRSIDLLPRDLWYPSQSRARKKLTSALVFTLMAASCLLSIFCMQLFSSWLEQQQLSHYIFSGTNAVLIVCFNAAWRHMALALCSWENHHLEPHYRERLTYLLFGFQCINSYFSLWYIAFLKPFGIRIFGIEMAACDIVVPDGSTIGSCADQLRGVIFSILVLNIVVGQTVEVGSLLIAGHVKDLISDVKLRFQRRRAATATDSSDFDAPALARKERNRAKLGRAEEASDTSTKKILDLIAEYERAPVKTVKQGLGSTFYEYNELAIQYGFVIMFSLALPIAPLLALLNNLVEFRSDAFKMIYVARRIAGSRAKGIGPWMGVLRVLTYMGVACNFGFLLVTTDFFSRLAVVWPVFEMRWVQVTSVFALEHFLLVLKVTVDFLVPDMPEAVQARLARTEFLSGVKVDMHETLTQTLEDAGEGASAESVQVL